jgi:hypothetical protein
MHQSNPQKNSTTVLTPAPVNVPPGKSSTVCKLQVVNSAFLRALEALSVLLKKVFLKKTAMILFWQIPPLVARNEPKCNKISP